MSLITKSKWSSKWDVGLERNFNQYWRLEMQICLVLKTQMTINVSHDQLQLQALQLALQLNLQSSLQQSHQQSAGQRQSRPSIERKLQSLREWLFRSISQNLLYIWDANSMYECLWSFFAANLSLYLLPQVLQESALKILRWQTLERKLWMKILASLAFCHKDLYMKQNSVCKEDTLSSRVINKIQLSALRNWKRIWFHKAWHLSSISKSRWSAECTKFYDLYFCQWRTS